jgi:hypothetical protein
MQIFSRLFIGGPLDGQIHPVEAGRNTIGFEQAYAMRPMTFLAPEPQGAKPCIELQEIEGLTGRTFHKVRRPSPMPIRIAEEDERRALLARHYLGHRWAIEIAPGEILQITVFIDSRLDAFDPALIARMEKAWRNGELPLDLLAQHAEGGARD